MKAHVHARVAGLLILVLAATVGMPAQTPRQPASPTGVVRLQIGGAKGGPESNIASAQSFAVTVEVSGGAGNPTPTGTVTLSSGSYASEATGLSSGAATITVPAGSLAAGNDTLTAKYSGDSIYSTATGMGSVTVLTGQPGFTAGSGGTTSLTNTPGQTSTGTVSVVGTNGFSGTVSLSCNVTTSVANASDLPACSLNPASVTISGTAAQTSKLTVTTTAASSARNQMFWASAGGTALALVALFAVPRRRRDWLTMMGLLLLVVSLGAAGCGGGSSGGGGGGGGNSGTTAGTYTIAVTGASGSISATVGTVALTVQ